MSVANPLPIMRSGRRSSAESQKNAGPTSLVDSVHQQIRKMAITLRFPHGVRVNETTLAEELGVSRTPVREALNRLTNEGFLTYSANYGFFRKPLDVQEIFDMYELRLQVEMGAVRLIVERATDEQLIELESLAQGVAQENPCTMEELTSLDEEFHDRLVMLTGNIQMRNALQKINDHIRYFRRMDMIDRGAEILLQHTQIAASLRGRHTEQCMRLMVGHIGLPLEQIMNKMERSYGRIYMASRMQADPQRVQM